MNLSELIFNTEVDVPAELLNTAISKISTTVQDSSEGTLLFILNQKSALEISKIKKPDGILVFDKNVEIPDKIKGRKSTLVSDNARALLAYAQARLSRIDFSLTRFIGITGTNGKTSTATFIKKILIDAGYSVGFIGTGRIEHNGRLLTGSEYSMTTPDPWILYPAIKEMQNDGCEVIVMEVSSHALSLDKVAPISFDYGIFTNLSSEHMDFHKDMEDYFLAKQRLFEKCSSVIFNLDDAYGRRAYKEYTGRKIGAGILWKGDVWATCIENNGFDGTEYMYRERGFLFKMKLALAGIHNIYNSMLAAAVCIDMGVKPCMVKRTLAGISTLPGRFEIIRDSVTVIIDYAHTSFAFESVLKEIRQAKLPSETLWLIFGAGGERDREKRPRLAKIAEKFADKIVLTSDNSRSESPSEIINDIKRGFSKNCYTVIEDREEAIKYAIKNAAPSSIIAIIGKGAEKYNIDSEGYHPFDEKKIISRALAIRKGDTVVL